MNKFKKTVAFTIILCTLLSSLAGCNGTKDNDLSDIDTTAEQTTVVEIENISTEEEIIEETTATQSNESEFDSATYMRYTLNSDGKSYSVYPEGIPDTIKELVFPGEYKGLPVTKIKGDFKGEYSIETIVISDGIEEILIGFDYCRDIKNIYIPSSVIHIQEGAFNCRATMGGHGFTKSNVIEKIVVAEGNPYYYVEGNCLIERISKKVILGCNNSVIPSDGSVKSIGYAAFANCHSIETIVIPESIIEIEDSAFDNCDNLKQVYITSSVSEDKKVVNFDEEFAFGYNSERIFYVPDAESLEVYSKLFRPHINIQISTEAENEEATSVETEESTSAEIEENESTPIDYSQISNLPYIYQQVLDNKKSFILYGDEMFIDEYKSPYLQKQLSTCDHVEYSILDMDGNGDVELLIKGWTEDILVLHIENDIVYGYDFTFRGMYNVEEDGSFCWNNNAGNSYGVSKLVFKNQECNIVEIYRVENDNTYYVNNKEVSKEEFDLLITNRENVNQITWYDMATYPKQIDGKILYNDWDFPECAIYQDNNGEFFVHIKAWNIYRKIDLSSIKWEDGYGPVFKFNSFSISDDSASIAIYNYDKKYSYISIYHIEKGTLDVQEYSAQFEATSFYECAEFGINMIDEQITYFFLYGETNPDYKLGNSFIRFETFDGGKSWGDPQNISKDHYKYHCEKMEFLTKDFGYCIHGHGDVFSTLLTTDGGSTWEHAKITFPFDVNDLITYKNIKMTNNQYILTVTVHTTNTYDLQYISTDFVNWTLCEPQ